jgi:Ca-activated chloride channel family protein
MSTIFSKAGLATCCLLALSTVSNAQETRAACTDDAMLVFDGSGSMSAVAHNGLKSPRILEARTAIRNSIPNIAPFRRLGLVIFGPGAEDSCSNIDLRFTPQSNAAPRIISDVDNLSPVGETPLTDAVQEAVDTLGLGNDPGVVVLLTDGRESCGGDPCALANRLAADGRVTVHVIGFKVREQYFQWNGHGAKNGRTTARCLADQTGGKYVSAESTQELTEALQETLACPMTARGAGQTRGETPG